MDEYQKEQFDAFSMVVDYLAGMPTEEIQQLSQRIDGYLAFRKSVNEFLSTHFTGICSLNCYQNRKSACCSKEGIVTFFADVVINVLKSGKERIEDLMAVLQKRNSGFKCIYLGENGCMWRLKPIVCEMFLCKKAKSEIFENNAELAGEWDSLKKREKLFTWPDRPVLFDEIEAAFLKAGLKSPLMYMHNSPGLLRVKSSYQLSVMSDE